ncbi:MAG: FadR/GntR family transcriptional regulator [Eikenella sp.]|nr:FadR/GntR family transcriptional regulator [Eikenella sp.]
MSQNTIVKAQKLSEQISSVLEERILSGIYPVGSRLPAERLLAEEFGVSRPPVRDALRTLATRGLTFSKPGGGHYVSEDLHTDFLSSWQSLIQRHDYLRQDVLDFRRHIEGTLAALAAERRTETDLQRLQYWLLELEAAHERQDLARQAEADVAFHQAIADAAHNTLFSHLAASLLLMIHKHTQSNLANMFSYTSAKEDLRGQHRAIFHAIASGEPDAAAAVARRHIDFVADTLQAAQEHIEREQISAALAEKDRKRRR